MNSANYTKAFLIATTLETCATGWFSGTYVLFLLDHGLTLAQANTLNIGFMVTNFALTIPFGFLADRVGRRMVFVLGQIAWGLGMLTYGIGSTFPVFACAEIIGAIGNALMFGTLDSWLRLHLNEEGRTHRINALAGSASVLATIPTAILGVAIGEAFGRQWPWFLAGFTSLLSAVISGAIVFRLEEIPASSSQDKKGQLLSLNQIGSHIKDVWSLVILILISLGIAVGLQSFNMFWAPIFRDKSGGSWWLGWFWAGISISTSLGNWLASTKFVSGKINGLVLVLPLVVIGASMTAIGQGDNLSVAICLFLVHEVARGFFRPVEYTLWNRPVGHTIRSTANSIRQAATTLGAAIGLGLSGYLTTQFSPLVVWNISGWWIFAVALFVVLCRGFFRKRLVWIKQG